MVFMWRFDSAQRDRACTINFKSRFDSAQRDKNGAIGLFLTQKEQNVLVKFLMLLVELKY